jgi:hypothetical protein
MRGLLSDRFLNRFAGKRKGRRRQPTTKLEEQDTNPEEASGSDSHETAEDRGKEASDIEEISSPNEIQHQAGASSSETQNDCKTKEV